MPLLGNRLHVLNTLFKKPKKNSEVTPIFEFVVPETKEICLSEDELKRKKTIYESKIWTCRVTGRANLTYKEAIKSEHTTINILKKAIADHYRTEILQIVHKNTLPLEPLTQACWIKAHEQFVVGEPVLLKVDSNKPIHATVLSVDTSANEPVVIDLSKEESSSPNNSDKENNINAKRPPVFKKDFSYNVKLVSDDPVVVNHVPSSCIQRIHRAPSKDHIRMFIRAYAMRYGPCSSGPWIVGPSALRKYCPTLKIANNLIDKGKLRQVSESYELKFYEKIIAERNKGNALDGKSGVKLSPKSLKEFKNFSALRCESPKKSSSDGISQKVKETPEGKPSKKMKQATLHFTKSNSPSSGKKGKPGTLVKSEVPLPSIAKRLIRCLKANSEGNKVKLLVTRCVSILTDAQVMALPVDAQKLVMEKRIDIENRKKLQTMTPEEQKAYLRDLRMQRRALVDENASFLETGVQVVALPEPRAFPLPPGISPLQFSRVLCLTEFLACYQPLLTEYALSPGELLYPSRVKQLASDLCRSTETDDEEFNTDDEEESALTSTDAVLPKASIRGLRRLSLDRVLRAVAEKHMSASAYQCLARPMSALLRQVFLSDQFSKQKELGIQLSKIPVTPYTAPELLRLLLEREVANNIGSTNDRALARIRQLITSNGGDVGSFVPPRDVVGAASLLKCLTSSDLFALDPEYRILAIEILVEWMLDLDTMDEYMHTSSKKASDTWQARLTLTRQKKTVLPAGYDDDDDKLSAEKEPNSDDLASIVKNRRVLAAKAAEEREIREAKVRERRELEAKIDAEERALAKAEHEHTIASTEAKFSFRVSALGTDRFDRRYWRFFSSPNRLFVEANWAPDEYHVGDASTKEKSAVATFPPPHLFPDNLANCQAVRQFGYAARSRWFVFDRPDQLDALANALVERGVRESHLKKNLVQVGLLDNMKELIMLTEAAENHPEFKSVNSEDIQPKSANETAIDKITAKVRGDAEAILANVLLKNLYETEIHLRDGGLGGVPDFATWQSTILSIQAKYGLCFSLTGSTPPTPVVSPVLSKSAFQSLAAALVAVGRNVHRRFLNVPKLKSRQSFRHSDQDNGDASSHEENDCDSIKGGCDVDEEERRPHETTEVDKLRVHDVDVELWIDTWVRAVNSAATLTRLNVLHACLDACILWEKSVANVRCRICRRNKDDESLLLCDGCNSGFHLYCLRPPLHSIPRGDWFCLSCKPPTAPSRSATTNRQRRNRQQASEESDSDDSEASSLELSSQSTTSEDVVEEQRLLRGRLRQRPSARQLPSRSSSRSSQSSKPLPKSASSSNLLSNDSVCLVCDEEGTEVDELIACSTCSNAFHPNCHNPPLRSAHRRAPWVCSVCRVGRASSGSLSAMGQSLRLRASSRINRKNSYLRLHRISTAPRKRPRPISDSESSVDESDGGVEDDDETNDTEATEEQADEGGSFIVPEQSSTPPAKRPKTAFHFTCADLIAAVRRHRSSWPFQDPVNANEVPDYYEIVVDPIDLSQITRFLQDGRYDGDDGPQLLSQDLAKMFYNAELYNSSDSSIWKAGAQLESYVQSLFRKFPNPVKYKREKLN
uniref:Bromodomain adjacent to zinc finger domain protein 1A n=2 Tax=Mesocestoides corti TaxID=53468 RepID=A0A5K3EW47_MESCO